MSSTSYSANLTPDPRLRTTVLCSGRALFGIGLAVILSLPLSTLIRSLVSLSWLAMAFVQTRDLRLGFESTMSIRLHEDGSVEVRDTHRQWLPGSLLTGSIVLARLAFLRIQLDNGRQIVELLRGDARKSHDWRRLQVIWRHVGAAQ